MTRQYTDEERLTALRMLLDAIMDAVAVAGPMGAPSGTIYAALMTAGITLDQYEGLMAGLVDAGRLRRSGDLYFTV